MADDRFASVADALLRIQSARSLEEAVQIAHGAAQRSAQATGGFDGDRSVPLPVRPESDPDVGL
jgi:hypothetical protein